MSNFTPRAQQVLALARKEADRFNHNFLGTEHLLLGLIKLGQGVAVNVIQKICLLYTSCPTNLGTGIRVSAMLHLPGLVLAEQINPIIQSVNKLGLAVRGLYGEGTEALGNVFQVSNQMTLGESEATIVERLDKVLLQIIEHEENARQMLLEKKTKVVYNPVSYTHLLDPFFEIR